LGLRLGLEEAARAVSNTYIRLGLNPRVILLGEGWGRRRARAVIYDLDGTLVEFRFDVAGSRRAVISRLEALGFDTRRLGPRTLTQEILEEVRRQTGRGGVRHPVEAVISLVDRELGRFELAAAERAEALPWTFEVVRETRRRGYATALVTNSGRAAVARVIDRLGLDPRLFDVVVTRNDVNNLKPAGEPLLKALEALGVPPGDALYVGDSVIDIGAARAAGVRVVSVASGLYPSEKLRAAGPDALIPSLWELLALL
jgi:phosphoglycolate phosphatase